MFTVFPMPVECQRRSSSVLLSVGRKRKSKVGLPLAVRLADTGANDNDDYVSLGDRVVAANSKRPAGSIAGRKSESLRERKDKAWVGFLTF